MSDLFEGANGMRQLLSIVEDKDSLQDIIPPVAYKELKRWYKDLKPEADMSFMQLSAYDILFDYYAHEMPYGTAKARTGDPDEWIFNQIVYEFGDELES